MRIAIVGARGYPSSYGGFETFLLRLVPFLADQGHEVLVYDRLRGSLHRTDRVGGVLRRRTFGLGSKRLSTLTHGLAATIDLSIVGADVALVLNPANGLFLPILARRGIPTAVNVDGLEWERGKWGRLARSMFVRGAIIAADQATELVMDSASLLPVWIDQFGRGGTYIPYGADILNRDQRPNVDSVGLSSDKYVLAVARLVPENNIEMLLDATESLDIPVAVVGTANYTNPLQTRLRHLAASKPGFVWLGHVNDQALLESLWLHAGVYIHGHSVGGTNPSLVRAMGAGAPTLAFDTAFNREVLGNDTPNTFYTNHIELRTAICNLMASDEVRVQRSRAAREIVQRRYSWPLVLKRYETMLIDVAGQG